MHGPMGAILIQITTGSNASPKMTMWGQLRLDSDQGSRRLAALHRVRIP